MDRTSNRPVSCVLHGALNNTNFGDYLFGAIFLDKAQEVCPNVFIADMPKYGVNSIFREEMQFYKKCGIINFLNADVLIYISGGYFGEMRDEFRASAKRWIRYFCIGEIARILRKRIYIIGVGGGPLKRRFLRESACRLIEYADIVTFRDIKTKEYFSNYIDCSKTLVTSDTALTLDEKMIPPLDSLSKQELSSVLKCEKKLLIHIADHKITDEMMMKLAEPINLFLNKHNEYGVIFTYDGYEESPIEKQELIRSINAKEKAIYHYHGVLPLCALIREVDCVITPKLHMGIVSSRLGKSVISFPYNSGKVMRFYEQIGEPERCLPLNEINNNKVFDLLVNYSDCAVRIPDDLYREANRNIVLMQNGLMSLSI